MNATVDLKQMSLAEKLGLMEALWDELCRREEEIPIPDWHKELLDQRQREIEGGKAKFIDWETAKERIARRTS